MPQTPPDRQIQIDIRDAVQSIDSQMGSLITSMANLEAAVLSQSADLTAIADAQVIHEQLARSALDYKELEYRNKYGGDTDLDAILAIIAAIPTQV